MQIRYLFVIVWCVIATIGVHPATSHAASKASVLATGRYHSCVVVNGSVYCWGDNGDGQLGDGNFSADPYPQAVLAQLDGGVPLTNAATVAAGDSHTCALVKTGSVYCWGSNAFGQLGDGTTNDNSDGILAQLSDGSDLTNVTAITASGTHTCALTKAKIAYCWGYNGLGQIGDGTTTDANTGAVRAQMNDTSALTNVTAIAAGRYHTCALTTTKTVYCWGYNDNGQLGNNDGTYTSTTGAVLAAMADTTPLTNVTALTAGEEQTCVITKTSAVYCWGDNSYGQLGDGTTTGAIGAVASQFSGGSALTSMTSISAGYTHTCALSKVGAVYCWGNNASGQLGIESAGGTQTQAALSRNYDGFNLASIQSISAGGYHTCVHTKAKSISCWGDNTYGQLGNDTTTNNSLAIPAQYAVKATIAKNSTVAAGNQFTCSTTKTSQSYCWGLNGSSQLGDGTTTNHLGGVSPIFNQPDALSSMTQIAVGIDHACALTKTGNVYCWGGNGIGQLGHGTDTDRTGAVRATILGGYELTNVVSIAAGEYHTCALTKTGNVYCWGYNNRGQLGNGNAAVTMAYGAVLVRNSDGSPLSNIKGIAAGVSHTCTFDKSGTVYCWGLNNHGQLGDNTQVSAINPTATLRDDDTPLTGVTALSGGIWQTCALTKTKTVYCWGFNGYGNLGDNSTTTRLKAVVAKMADGSALTNITSVATKFAHTCAVTTAGLIYCWGDNAYGKLGNRDASFTDTSGAVPVYTADGSLLSGIATVSLGASHSCATTKTQTVYCWGRNDYGQLGDGTTTDATTGAILAQMDGGGLLTNISSISLGTSHTCVLTKSSTVSCWGINGKGQLGDGTLVNRSTAAPAYMAVGTALSNISSVSAGISQHACVLIKSTSVYCWGVNTSGQLGNGTTTDATGAVLAQMADASTLSGVTAVSVGSTHTCVLTKSTSVYCWGDNSTGQLGDGTTTNATGAVLAQMSDGSALTSVKGISAGNGHTCAFTKTGAVYCWGLNDHGQLGNGTTTDATTGAVLVQMSDASALSNVTGISASNGFSCATTKAGAAYCWGVNTSGQLGDGTTTDATTGAVRAQMADTSPLSGVSSVSTGSTHTCATTKTGIAYCWGDNTYGQLGDGTTDNHTGAVAVHDVDDNNLPSISSVSAGASHSCAINKSGDLYCWGYNNAGQLGDDSTTNRDVAKLVHLDAANYITGVK